MPNISEGFIEWKEETPTWKNKGTKPKEEYIDNGFGEHDMPPPAWLNWIFGNTYKVLEEYKWRTEVITAMPDPSIMQITFFNREAGQTTPVGLPGDTRKAIDVYKIDEDERHDEVTVQRHFDNSYKDDFDYDDIYVEFGPEYAEIKTEYEAETSLEREGVGMGEQGEGRIYSTKIDLSKYEDIRNIEMITK